MVLRMSARMLTSAGAEVLEARSGREALALAGERGAEITCVVCGLAMPDLDGWETLGARRDRRPGLPAIVVSGLDPEHPARRAHADVPHRFLAKPYRLEDLVAAVAAASGGREGGAPDRDAWRRCTAIVRTQRLRATTWNRCQCFGSRTPGGSSRSSTRSSSTSNPSSSARTSSCEW